MKRSVATAGYMGCLLRFEGEDNATALDRVTQNYRPGVNEIVDSLHALSYSGITLTPRMLEDFHNIRISQDGLKPEAIGMYLEALGKTDRERKVSEIVAELTQSHDVEAAIAALATLPEGKSSNTQSLAEHIALGMEAFYRRQDAIRNKVAGVMFPWAKLNERLPYIHQDDLGLITAQSKMGKSSAVHQIALRNAMHLDVLYFHNEDSIERLNLRRLAQMQFYMDRDLTDVGLRYSDLISRTIKSKAMLERIDLTNKLALKLIDDRLTYVYCSGWTPEQICAKWYQMRSTQKIGLVIIDYLNKIEMSHLESKYNGSRAYALDYTVEKIKRQAGIRGMETPCVLVQQENEDNTVRDSRSSYIKAQWHISLRRAEEGDTIELVRANDGDTGSIDASFYAPYMVWLT